MSATDMDLEKDQPIEEEDVEAVEEDPSDGEDNDDDVVGKEVDLKKDGGLIKKILVAGSGWETPKKGADVKVHYVGTLQSDGSKFDSSRDRDEPFTFKLGQGQVIKGWDEGVATMKKGEKALFTIRSDYAYGKNGSPPKIPADATLLFEVELLSWTDEVDVTKDGGVLKKILVEGSGWEKPKDDSTVTVNYVARLSGGDGEVVDRQDGFRFVLGADEVVSGLDKGVESMKKGEKALLKVKADYAYGSKGNEEKKIPPGAALEYEVELTDFTKEKQSWEMSTEEKFEACKQNKDQGNDFYKAGNWKRAVKKYKKAAGYVDSDYSLKEEEKAQAKPLKLACHLNTAACQLKLKEWKNAIESCKKALEIESENVKALFRRGQALSAQDEWALAEADFNKALEIEPDNKEVKRELALLKRKVAEQDKKDRKRFAGMFEKLAKVDQEKELKDKGKEKVTADSTTA